MISQFTFPSSKLLKESLKSSPKPNKKSVSIVNFRALPKLDEDFVNRELIKLTRGLTLVLYEDGSKVSLENLHRIVDNLHGLENRDRLFDTLTIVLEEYLKNQLELLLVNSPQALFKQLIDLWTYYTKKIAIIKNIYLKFDRCSQNGMKYNISRCTAVNLFKDIIVRNYILKRTIETQLSHAISCQRREVEVNIEEINAILVILLQLSVYHEIFEETYLLESKQFFHDQSMLVHQIKIEQYLELVKRYIKNESLRNYVTKETIEKVLQIIYQEMVNNHLETIFDQRFIHLMDNDSRVNVSTLYDLCSNVPKGINILTYNFNDYVLHHGTYIIEKFSEKHMIEELLIFKDTLDEIIKTCFKGNSSFLELVKTALTKIINTKGNDPAQSLAKYLDSKLRSKYLSEEEMETILKKVMVIFRYIQGKDVFEAFYRKDLARRLIFGKSTNQDEERSVIAKLKAECGDCFTVRLEGIFRDINISKDISNDFKQYLTNLHPNLRHSDISVIVLTSSFWTKSLRNHQAIIPSELLHYQTIFRKFYCITHSGKKLDWQPNLEHCIVRASFGRTIKELHVSLFQTIILLLFNDNDILTASQIQELTKLDEDELKITLHSLSCKKTKLLLRSCEENAIKMEDVFRFNHNFSNKLFRIKLNQIQMRESTEEQKITERSVASDRQFQIDAAIVRILKKRRLISHNELVTEVFELINCPIEPQFLKNRIELLVDREYVKRDSNNSNMYAYVA